MKQLLTKLGAVILLASIFTSGFAQQTRNYWPGAGPTSRTFGVFWDFVRDQEYNSTDFTTTLVSAGGSVSSIAAEDLLYGTLLFTTDDAAADGAQMQSLNTCFAPAAGKHTVIATRFITGADVTNDLIDIGICGTDTTAVVGHANGISFRKADTETTLKLAMVGSGGGTTSDYTTYTIGTLAVSSSYEVVADIYPYSGDVTKAYVKVWFNGTLVVNRSVSVDVPTAVMSPFAGILVGASAAARTIRLDYLGASQDR
jgi:hypothetical protein